LPPFAARWRSSRWRPTLSADSAINIVKNVIVCNLYICTYIHRKQLTRVRIKSSNLTLYQYCVRKKLECEAYRQGLQRPTRLTKVDKAYKGREGLQRQTRLTKADKAYKGRQGLQRPKGLLRYERCI
jgi:hypothetical protein